MIRDIEDQMCPDYFEDSIVMMMMSLGSTKLREDCEKETHKAVRLGLFHILENILHITRVDSFKENRGTSFCQGRKPLKSFISEWTYLNYRIKSFQTLIIFCTRQEISYLRVLINKNFFSDIKSKDFINSSCTLK